MRRDLPRLRIDDRNIGLVFNIDKNVSPAVSNRLLRRATQIDCPHHRAVYRVDDRRVWRTVTKDVDPLIECVEEDAVWSAVDINSFDRGQGFGVPHNHWFAAGKAVAGFGVYYRAAGAGLRDFADGRKRIEIEDANPTRRWRRSPRPAARNIQPASGRIGVDIIKPTCATDSGPFLHLIWSRCWALMSRYHWRQHDNSCDDRQRTLSHGNLLY